MEIMALQASRENTELFMSGKREVKVEYKEEKQEGGGGGGRREVYKRSKYVHHSTFGKGGGEDILQLFCIYLIVISSQTREHAPELSSTRILGACDVM